MADIKLRAELRLEKSTKKSLSTTRQELKIPGVVYGSGGKNIHVVVVTKELTLALKAGGTNAIIHLQHDKGEETVIVRELQRHVVTGTPIHVDFQRIDLKKEIEVKVPIHVTGEAIGVKLHGGVLEHVVRELAVRGLPTAIPQKIDINVDNLGVGQGILVKDVVVPAGLKLLDDPAKVVLNVVQAMKEEEAAPAAAEVPVEGAEPEVIAKGKKEEGEEGEEGAAPAKGAAPGKGAAPEKGAAPAKGAPAGKGAAAPAKGAAPAPAKGAPEKKGGDKK